MGNKANPSRPPLIRGGEQAFPPDKGGSRGVKPFIPYNKTLTERVRENRKTPTIAETRMWNEVLRLRQLAQYKFLRQKPIASFIVDFYCAELGLVIEIDGHDHVEKADYDLERSRTLNRLGLVVIRYGNDEVMQNLEGVYEDLVGRIQNLTPLAPPLSGGKARTPPLKRGKQAIRAADARIRGGREGFENCDTSSEDNSTP